MEGMATKLLMQPNFYFIPSRTVAKMHDAQHANYLHQTGLAEFALKVFWDACDTPDCDLIEFVQNFDGEQLNTCVRGHSIDLSGKSIRQSFGLQEGGGERVEQKAFSFSPKSLKRPKNGHGCVSLNSCEDPRIKERLDFQNLALHMRSNRKEVPLCHFKHVEEAAVRRDWGKYFYERFIELLRKANTEFMRGNTGHPCEFGSHLRVLLSACCSIPAVSPPRLPASSNSDKKETAPHRDHQLPTHSVHSSKDANAFSQATEIEQVVPNNLPVLKKCDNVVTMSVGHSPTASQQRVNISNVKDRNALGVDTSKRSSKCIDGTHSPTIDDPGLCLGRTITVDQFVPSGEQLHIFPPSERVQPKNPVTNAVLNETQSVAPATVLQRTLVPEKATIPAAIVKVGTLPTAIPCSSCTSCNSRMQGLANAIADLHGEHLRQVAEKNKTLGLLTNEVRALRNIVDSLVQRGDCDLSQVHQLAASSPVVNPEKTVRSSQTKVHELPPSLPVFNPEKTVTSSQTKTDAKDNGSTPAHKKLRLLQSAVFFNVQTRELSKSGRRKRKAWSKEEEDCLRRAVTCWGTAWHMILEKHPDVFKLRKSIDLKDKWSNMTKDKYD